MTDDLDQERRGNGKARKRRLTSGAISMPGGFAIGYVICYVLYKVFLLPEDTNLTIAICSVTGSATTWGAMCARDIRGILLQRYKRRVTDQD